MVKESFATKKHLTNTPLAITTHAPSSLSGQSMTRIFLSCDHSFRTTNPREPSLVSPYYCVDVNIKRKLHRMSRSVFVRWRVKYDRQHLWDVHVSPRCSTLVVHSRQMWAPPSILVAALRLRLCFTRGTLKVT